MKNFKRYLKESQEPIVAYCSIGYDKGDLDQLGEHFWEKATPMSEYDPEKHGVSIPSEVSREYRIHMDYQVEPKLYMLHKPYLHQFKQGGEGDTHNFSKEQNHLYQYVITSKPANMALLHAHQMGIKLDTIDDTAAALEAAHKVGDLHKYTSYTEHNRTPAQIHEHIQVLRKLVGEAPESPIDHELYTGVGYKMNIMAGRQAGKYIVHLPAFTSTSLVPEVAMHFSRHLSWDDKETKPYPEMLRIRVKKGQHAGLYHGNDSGFVYGAEHENILQPDTRLRLIGEPRILDRTNDDNLYSGKHKYLIHDAEIMDDDQR